MNKIGQWESSREEPAKRRIPNVGETVFYWWFPRAYQETILSGEVVAVNEPGQSGHGLAYVTVTVSVGKNGITSLHGANPAVKNDRDDWFFTESECRAFARAEIAKWKAAIKGDR